MPPGFDINAARQAGYSDDEILAHLTQTRNFDVNRAVSSGYSKDEIINYLSSRPDTSGNPPGVPRPERPVNYANPLPTENIPVAGALAQPFGELGANLYYDKGFRAETAKYGAQSAAVTGGLVGAAAAAPAVVSAFPTVARNAAREA